MNQTRRTLWIVHLSLLLVMLLVGCVDVTGPSDDKDQPTLRVHDVSALNVERLDRKLNQLLGQEGSPLRGKVELMDDNRLAVNGSLALQHEIERLLEELGNDWESTTEVVVRPFRIQFWLLQMSKQEALEPLPADLDEVVRPIAREFPGFDVTVQDFIESFHVGPARMQRLQSGAGTLLVLRGLQPTVDGVAVHARVQARPPNETGSQIQYQVNQTLQPGKALVLGRAHGGGMGEEATYQVLIARMEWTD